jgi:hypothetical protein
MIGVGGPSESGKTAVAILLSEILRRAGEGQAVPVICQSDFAKRDLACPAVRFRPYSNRDRQLFKHIGPGASGLIDAHDRECIASCRWEEFETRVRQVKRGFGVPGRNEEETRAAAEVVTAHGSLVQEGVRRLVDCVTAPYGVENYVLDVRPAVVEGVLLLARTEGERSGVAAATGAGQGGDLEEGVLHRPGAGPLDGRDLLSGAESAARQRLGRYLDVKLFLRTDRETAKKRRFAKPEYRDVGKGGLREPHELWRFEGYFDDIAW